MSPVLFANTQENQLSDEEYVIYRAKVSQKHDEFSAKAWMITAKTLFPRNFAVQVVQINEVSVNFEKKLECAVVSEISYSWKRTLHSKLQTTQRKLPVTSLVCEIQHEIFSLFLN